MEYLLKDGMGIFFAAAFEPSSEGTQKQAF